jgi:hypothetical protein
LVQVPQSDWSSVIESVMKALGAEPTEVAIQAGFASVGFVLFVQVLMRRQANTG